MNEKTIIEFQRKLLKWYDQHARILPWRDNPSPYRVWISEVMLQQTKVDTVKPYFERFMKEVPSISDLANLSEDKLLKLWEGLGYYSRARNLKKAAIGMEEKFEGKVPSDRRSLESLSGIGPYTAGAISSIAFNKKEPAVDGNVIRVIARVTGNEKNMSEPKGKKEIEIVVKDLLPKERVGDFNQALMELGATICLPKSLLKCSKCPVQSLCEGRKKGIAETLPVKTKKKKRKIEKRTVFILHYKGKVALGKRPEEGLLSNLWEFPNVEGHLTSEECKENLKNFGIEKEEQMIALPPSKHIFTHLEWHMEGYFIQLKEIPKDSKVLWVTKEEIKGEYAIPSAFKAYQKFLFQHLEFFIEKP